MKAALTRIEFYFVIIFILSVIWIIDYRNQGVITDFKTYNVKVEDRLIKLEQKFDRFEEKLEELKRLKF